MSLSLKIVSLDVPAVKIKLVFFKSQLQILQISRIWPAVIKFQVFTFFFLFSSSVHLHGAGLRFSFLCVQKLKAEEAESFQLKNLFSMFNPCKFGYVCYFNKRSKLMVKQFSRRLILFNSRLIVSL